LAPDGDKGVRESHFDNILAQDGVWRDGPEEGPRRERRSSWLPEQVRIGVRGQATSRK
jgi:hypothetical protein